MAAASPEPPPAPIARGRKGRIAAALLIAAVGAGLALLWRDAPRERRVELRVAEPSGVTALEITWIDAEGDALRHARHAFGHSQSAEHLSLPVSLADGEYRLLVRVERGAQSGESTHRIQFDGDADQATVFVR